MEEFDVLASTRIALGLKVYQLQLRLAQSLLKVGLLLLQVCARLTLSCNVLLDLRDKGLRTAHLLHSCGSKILLLCKAGLEIKDLFVGAGNITERSISLGQLLQPSLGLFQAGLHTALLPDKRVSLRSDIINGRPECAHLRQK